MNLMNKAKFQNDSSSEKFNLDNTQNQYKRVCMPVHLDEHIHMINRIIEYIKKIYSIEKEECMCPYIRNSSGYWIYIEEEERNKTVNDFADCGIVFYYIEEGIKDDYFTFAEFESYIQPEGKQYAFPSSSAH